MSLSNEDSSILRQAKAIENETRNRVFLARKMASDVIPPGRQSEKQIAFEKSEAYVETLEMLHDKFNIYKDTISKSVHRKFGDGLKYYMRFIIDGGWDWRKHYKLSNLRELEKLAQDLEKQLKTAFAKFNADRLAGLSEKQMLMAVRIGLPKDPGGVYFARQRGSVFPESWMKDKPLIEEDDEEYLKSVCSKIGKNIQEAKAMEGPIQVDPRHFTNTKTWKLLIDIMYDAGRGQVKCEERTLRELKSRLRRIGKKVHKSQYFILANNLKWKNGRACTEISFGQIKIPQKSRE